MKNYAHSLEGSPVGERQPLEEHLYNTAKLAAEFARPFGGEEWAYLAEDNMNKKGVFNAV